MTLTDAYTQPIEEVADWVGLAWRDHANQRAFIQVVQGILRDRMMADATLKMKTPKGTTARIVDPQYHGTPSQRRRARERDAGVQCKVYWSAA
jgi:hypothetical protein